MARNIDIPANLPEQTGLNLDQLNRLRESIQHNGAQENLAQWLRPQEGKFMRYLVRPAGKIIKYTTLLAGAGLIGSTILNANPGLTNWLPKAASEGIQSVTSPLAQGAQKSWEASGANRLWGTVSSAISSGYGRMSAGIAAGWNRMMAPPAGPPAA